MNQHRFAALPRSLTRVPSRRDVLRGLGAAGLGLVAARWPGTAGADKRRKSKPKPLKPNAFGCLNVGDRCRNAGQCCSDACRGRKGKKRCQSHDTGGCQAGHTPKGCGGEENVSCTTSRGDAGKCFTTTGNAGYCGLPIDPCGACDKDAECRALLGPGAACVLCPGDCADEGGRLCAFLGS